MLTFLVFLSFTVGHTSCTCLKPGLTWLSNDILDTVHPVPDPYQCQAVCVDNQGCTAFTWTSQDNQRFELHCFLFGSNTGNTTSCEECVSGPASCTCSSEVACHSDEDNIIDEIMGVQTEAECQNHCLEDSLCLFYTWQSSESFPAYSCLLLSSCEDTLPCQGCYTGPPECSQQIQTSTTTTSPTMEGKGSL